MPCSFVGGKRVVLGRGTFCCFLGESCLRVDEIGIFRQTIQDLQGSPLSDSSRHRIVAEPTSEIKDQTQSTDCSVRRPRGSEAVEQTVQPSEATAFSTRKWGKVHPEEPFALITTFLGLEACSHLQARAELSTARALTACVHRRLLIADPEAACNCQQPEVKSASWAATFAQHVRVSKKLRWASGMKP